MSSRECPNCSAPVETESLERLIKCTYCNTTVENPFYVPPQPQPRPAPRPIPYPHYSKRAVARSVKGAVIGVIVAVSVITLMVVGMVVALMMSAAPDPHGVGGGLALELGDFARTTKQVYAPGEVVQVQYYNMPASGSNWIALCHKGQTEGEYITYEYTGGEPNGELTLSDEALKVPGEFEIRVYFEGGYALRSTSSFVVDPAGATPTEYVRLPRREYAAGEKVAVQFLNMPTGNSAWISLAKQGSTDNQYVTYQYTGDVPSGQLLMDHALIPGYYEIRVYLDSGYDVSQRVPLVVR